MTITTIDPPTRITRPGTYTLARDVEQGAETPLSETCIRIEASDVVLDGAGHTVAGNGVSDTTGVAAASSTELENVVVENVTLTDWDRGVLLRDVTDGVLRGVSVVGNGSGVSFENTRNAVLRDSRVAGNLLGVHLAPSCEGSALRDSDVGQNRGRDVLDRSCSPTRTGGRSPG